MGDKVGDRITVTAEEAKNRLSKFQDKPFRLHQEETIEFASRSDKPFKIIELPTGGGKSLIGMTLAMMNRKTNYLCGTKILQSQLSEDFPEGVTLWGRDNYTCLKNDEFTCNHCTATRFDPCNEECVYKREKSRALESQVRILNYSYYLSEVQYAGKFRNSDLTIIDEADSLESTLIGFISLEFTDSDLFKLGMANGPRRKTTDAKDGVQSWIEFGEVAHAKSKRKAAELKAEVDSWDAIDEEWQLRTMKELERMVHISERCAMFLDNVDKSWILEQQDRVGKFQGKLIFRPLWITPELAEKYLLKHSKSWVLMSAAFLPKPVLAKILGIDEGDMDWVTVPSTFPIENRPINIWPVCDLKYSNMKEEVPKLIKGIRKVLNRHRGQKGLIHCSSYSLAKMIVEGVDDDRVITHGNKDRQAVVDHFVGSHGDAVLVSPSLERGINLPDDQCFHPDTLIRTSLGYKKISDIKIGDRVFTHNGRYRRVLATRERAYTGTMIKIKTYGGKETRVTPGHPILVDKYGNRKPYFHPVLGKWIGSPKPVKTSKAWKNSEELKKGDSILLPSGEQSMYFSLHNEFAINCLKGYQRTKIRGISTEQYSGSVYNLQVEQDESYTTDCLCAHNCRFQIVAKAPFLSLADKVVNKRVHSGRIGQMWYSSSMMLAVLQAAGRGVRHEGDYCECYILDKAVERAYELQPSLWPEWFRDAITWGANELV